MDKIGIGKGLSEKFLMGSCYFFDGMPDFSPKDRDYVVFVDEPIMFKDVMNMRGKTDDIFYWRKMSPDEFIKVTLSSGTPMQIGKFLVREVAQYLGFNINHLEQLKSVIDNIDDKHLYEKVIFDSYLKNGEFVMTDEQRLSAYEVYRTAKESEASEIKPE